LLKNSNKMKIIDKLNLPGWQVEIPDCGRNDLPEFFKDMGFSVGAEIGVERGEFAEIICRSGLKLYAVDPWQYYDDYVVRYPQKRLDGFYEGAKKRLSPYDCTIVRKTSMDAVKDFDDNSLDFVYIDGNHSFKYVVEDIWEWSKKVKKGGVISGHDYYNRDQLHVCDVKYVLDGYTRAAKLDKWFILNKKYGSRTDKARSWFWIK